MGGGIHDPMSVSTLLLRSWTAFFASVCWEEPYPTCFLSAVSTATSDHCLVVMDLDANLHVGRRFRFESFWPKVDGYLETVEQAWNSIPSVGNPYKPLKSELRRVAKALTSWSSKRVVGVGYDDLWDQ